MAIKKIADLTLEHITVEMQLVRDGDGQVFIAYNSLQRDALGHEIWKLADFDHRFAMTTCIEGTVPNTYTNSTLIESVLKKLASLLAPEDPAE